MTQTKLDISQDVIDEIVTVLARERPLGHERVPSMLRPYMDGGSATNYGVDNVVWALQGEINLSRVDFTPIGYGPGQTRKSPRSLERNRLFCLVTQEQDRIFSGYADAIGYENQ